MKKIIQLTFHYIFFICSLLFLPNEISLFISIMLISVLLLDKIYYSILPLSLCFYYPQNYTFILLGIFICNLVLYHFITKNRFYALTIYILSQLSAYIIILFQSEFNITLLYLNLFLLIIYSIINLLNIFKKIDNKYYILPYNQKLIYLTLLLAYLVLFIYFSFNQTILLFLFMQLYLIKDYKYKIIFTIIYTLILYFFFSAQISYSLQALAVTFFPPIILILFKYDNYIHLILTLYTILLTFFINKKKKISFDNNYINSLFHDFTKYIEKLSYEYNKNNLFKTIKDEKIKELSTTFCDKCHKNTLCKNKLDKRYNFLAASMLKTNTNIYDCPNYNNFIFDYNLDLNTNSLEYNGIRALSDELSYLYNQSLLLKDEYEYFIGLLDTYGYQILNLDINLTCKTIYFTITFTKHKQIIESLFIKLAYKAFGEKLELKIINQSDNIVVHFFKEPTIKITYAHTILAKNNNLISGDNYYIKKDYNSSYIFALSDGMGSGYNAYLESKDALKTIQTLTSYHFSFSTILRLLEDVYELKSNYDRYATLDLLYINTANRKMNLYKMGSTTTYILHNHELYTYENKALPLKLDDVNSAYEIDIYSGDYIFLLSDGISDFISKNEFYSLVSNGCESVEYICEKIIQYIKEKQKNQLEDDLSLIAIKAI